MAIHVNCCSRGAEEGLINPRDNNIREMYKGPIHALEEDELDELFELASRETRRVEVTVRGLARTGLRASEFAHMTSEWLDTKSTPPRIRVPAHESCECTDCVNKAEQSDRLSIENYWRPKSGSGARTVPVASAHEYTWDLIVEHLDEYGQIPVGRGAIWSRVEKFNDELELDGRLTPHVLRHTYGTQAVSRGLDIEELQSILGHSSIENTQVYVKLTGDQVAAAADEAWG